MPPPHCDCCGAILLTIAACAAVVALGCLAIPFVEILMLYGGY